MTSLDTAARRAAHGGRPLLSPRYTARLLQPVFLAVFLFGTVVITVTRPDQVSSRYLLASALVLVATALPFLPAFDRIGLRPWMMLMPALDFGAFILLRTEGLGGATNPLVMALWLPAIWVGLLRSRAALLAFLPLPIGVIAPDVWRLSAGVLSPDDAARAVTLIAIFPLVMVIAAILSRIMATALATRQEIIDREHDERMRAAEESERSRRLLDAVVDAVDVGVIVLGTDGEPILINRALRESPELSPNGGDPWAALLSVQAFELDRVTPIPHEQSSLVLIAAGESVTDRLVWVGPPGGSQRALSVSAIRVATEDDTGVVTVIVVQDVTEFVRALEAKDVFIATVSHELRTPLTTISGFLELIQEQHDKLDPAIIGWLTVIRRNVERQQLVVRDLLTAASTRSTPLALAPQQSDLGLVAAEAAIAIGPEADQKNIVITVQAPPTPGRFDPLRMAQVAENLLSNAVRYTPEGGSVSITTRDDGDALELVVRDTGIGIDEADRALLFEEFFRGSTARASAIRGVGLGLAVVSTIVTAHGGTVALDSEIGRGTTVRVRIPRGS